MHIALLTLFGFRSNEWSSVAAKDKKVMQIDVQDDGEFWCVHGDIYCCYFTIAINKFFFI